MRVRMYSKRNICFVPTYNCNANCPFCYARTFKEKFSGEMSWHLFKKAVDICLKEGKRNEISFLGGEPTIWKHINRAVAYLKKRNVQVSFFTNGISFSKVTPNCVLINIYNSFDDKIREKIKKNIAFYKKNKVEVGLRYNLVTETPMEEKKHDERFFNFALPLADYISISPAIPYIPSGKLGSRIFNLVKKFRGCGSQVKISRAIPICLFNASKFNYLRKECSLHTECYSEKNIVINPDGRTTFPCVNISKPSFDLFKQNLQEIAKNYKQFFGQLGKMRQFSQCQKCKHAIENKCQAGCLGMRSANTIETAIKKIKI